MLDIVNFLHVLGAIAVGFYLLLPFLLLRVGKLSTAAQEGCFNGLFALNRIGQYILIIQLLTGGYLISQQDYSTLWTIAVIVFFIATAAFAGMMSRPMKRSIANLKSAKNAGNDINKVTTLSIIVAVLLLIVIVLMSFPA